jgi:hypothetical protein
MGGREVALASPAKEKGPEETPALSFNEEMSV